MAEARLERLGDTRLFSFKVGELTLYEWSIESYVQFGRTTRKYSAINVEPCSFMMPNIEKHWKYTWHMSIEDALDCLEHAGIDPAEFIQVAEKVGWIIPPIWS